MATLKELRAKLLEVQMIGTLSSNLAAASEILKRIMALSEVALRDEVQAASEDEQLPLLHLAALWSFPLYGIARLLENSTDIDVVDAIGHTAIMVTAHCGRGEAVRFLANRKADLSIVSYSGDNVYTVVQTHPSTPQEAKASVYRALAEHGVTSSDISEGFRSTLNESTLIPATKRLAQEDNNYYFYFSVMVLATDELEVQARERNKDGAYPIIQAAVKPGMEEPLKRLQSAWCESANATCNDHYNAIMEAAFNGQADNMRTLATMGSDLSIKNCVGDDIYVLAQNEAQVLAALAEHGFTSSNIPPRFQSPLYFSSVYYANNVRTQRWMNRMTLMLCVNRVYKWSLSNQIEDERCRTLPDDLSVLGRYIAHCWFDVAGGEPDNGIARLIMSFAFGFNDSKSSFALIGMPKEGKIPETRARCSYCEEHSKKEMLQCCTSTRYCSVACQRAHFKKHKKVCDRKAFLAKRAAVAARLESPH
jgi:ankyrin repeat protein